MLSNSLRRRLSQLLTVVLLLSVIASIGGVAYVTTTPDQTDEPFTEFYILGPDGVANEYPTQLTPNESANLTVGVTNNEHSDRTYTVAVIDDRSVIEERNIDVAAGETWEDEITLRFETPLTHNLRIMLFVGDDIGELTDPYRELRLTTTVSLDG